MPKTPFLTFLVSEKSLFLPGQAYLSKTEKKQYGQVFRDKDSSVLLVRTGIAFELRLKKEKKSDVISVATASNLLDYGSTNEFFVPERSQIRGI